MCITITPAAAKFIKSMVRLGMMEKGGGAGGLRLTVKPGGCSGFDSSFTIESAPATGDTVVEEAGVTVFLPEESCALLRGYTVDFYESRMDGGLIFSNPGGGHACGCSSAGAAMGGGAPTVAGVKFFSERPASAGGSCSKG